MNGTKMVLVAAIASQLAMCSAETEAEWTKSKIGADGADVYSVVPNKTEEEFLVYRCDVGKEGLCSLQYLTSRPCKEKDEYDILAKTNSQAHHVTLICAGLIIDNVYVYAIDGPDFLEFRNAMYHSDKVALAISKSGGMFEAIRFDISGSYEAMGNVEELSDDMAAPKSEQKGYTQPTESGEF